MGCLFLIPIGISPRLGVAAIWLFTDWIDRAFNGWVLPLLGVILLPWTTALYTVGYIIGDAAAPWGILGIFIDIAPPRRLGRRGPSPLRQLINTALTKTSGSQSRIRHRLPEVRGLTATAGRPRARVVARAIGARLPTPVSN